MSSTQLDDTFVQFTSMEWGLRAAIIIIRTYIRQRFDTPRSIIARWSPPSENCTDKYVSFVCEREVLNPGQRIRFDQQNVICRLVHGMAIYETGYLVSFGRIENAWLLV